MGIVRKLEGLRRINRLGLHLTSKVFNCTGSPAPGILAVLMCK